MLNIRTVTYVHRQYQGSPCCVSIAAVVTRKGHNITLLPILYYHLINFNINPKYIPRSSTKFLFSCSKILGVTDRKKWGGGDVKRS
jgi:hypothetical protein